MVVLNNDDIQRLARLETRQDEIFCILKDMRQYIPVECVKTHDRLANVEKDLESLQDSIRWLWRTIMTALIGSGIVMLGNIIKRVL